MDVRRGWKLSYEDLIEWLGQTTKFYFGYCGKHVQSMAWSMVCILVPTMHTEDNTPKPAFRVQLQWSMTSLYTTYS